VRTLSEKEQGELSFWIDHLYGGCERELGRAFLEQWSDGARGRLARFARHIPGLPADAGAVWVDVGTGPYSVLMQAPAAVTKVMIDPLIKHYFSYGLIDVAAVPPASIFLEGAAEDLPLTDGLADFVVCTNTLDHVDDPWATTAELARVLKPGGSLALEVDTGGITDYMHPHAITAAAIDEHFAAAGLEKIAGHIPEHQGQRRPGAELYQAYYRRTAPLRTALPLRAIRDAIHPVLVQEGLHGFNIVRLRDPEEGDWFYALLQSDGAFSRDKVDSGAYRVLFRGRTLDLVQQQVETFHRVGRS
jgi:ubiquinone/menaquinone biosynthesis C-methylase UbiE